MNLHRQFAAAETARHDSELRPHTSFSTTREGRHQGSKHSGEATARLEFGADFG
jgi:hypothetical protein